MKLKTNDINWNNVIAVSKALQPWLKGSPSRDELVRVAPMLLKNDVLTACVKKADLDKACEGICQLIKIDSHEVTVKIITGLVEMMTMMAPLHEEFKDPNVPKPMLYEAMQARAGKVLDAFSDLRQIKKQKRLISITVNNTTNQTAVSLKGAVAWNVACALDDFFENTGQAYAHLLQSINDKKVLTNAVPEAQVRDEAESQAKGRALAHAL